MGQIKIGDAAALLGVSDDTVRRWVEQGRLSGPQGRGRCSGRRRYGAGRDAGRLGQGARTAGRGSGRRSARNHLTGSYKVVSDTVMSQVEMQCGPYRIVSLISTEAVRELRLEPGSMATAVIKATDVAIEAQA